MQEEILRLIAVAREEYGAAKAIRPQETDVSREIAAQYRTASKLCDRDPPGFYNQDDWSWTPKPGKEALFKDLMDRISVLGYPNPSTTAQRPSPSHKGDGP